MKRVRRTRDEAAKAEEQAVRLGARGATDREIGVALRLSESEARRKRQLGLARRREALAGNAADALARTEAELDEALRSAYRDHDAAPQGSPAQAGFLKLVIDLLPRRARLRGIDVDKLGLSIFPTPPSGGDSQPAPDANDYRALLQDAQENLREGARTTIELALASADGDVRLPRGEDDEEAPS